jgi:hypothetical protein
MTYRQTRQQVIKDFIQAVRDGKIVWQPQRPSRRLRVLPRQGTTRKGRSQNTPGALAGNLGNHSKSEHLPKTDAAQTTPKGSDAKVLEAPPKVPAVISMGDPSATTDILAFHRGSTGERPRLFQQAKTATMSGTVRRLGDLVGDCPLFVSLGGVSGPHPRLRSLLSHLRAAWNWSLTVFERTHEPGRTNRPN